MHPINFEGAQVIGKPENMTDEECSAIWARTSLETVQQIAILPAIPPALAQVIKETTGEQFKVWHTAWQPSYEDKIAIAAGRPIMLHIWSNGLPPMSVYTQDENGNANV